MKLETLIGHCSEPLGRILKTNSTPDSILKEYFNSKKYIGSKERKIITEIIFIHLRFLGFSEYVFKQIVSKKISVFSENGNLFKILLSLFINLLLYPNNLIQICKKIENLYSVKNGFEFLQNIIIDQINKNFNIDKIKEIIKDLDNRILEQKNEITNTKELSARYSIPEFILNSWNSYYTKMKINPVEIAESLLFPSQLTIRINKPNLSREMIIDKFKKEGIDCYPTMYSPFGIKLKERISLTSHSLYRKGFVEIQDEGSQLICFACGPSKNDKILDACAGAGGKSLLFAILQDDKGEIIANDINPIKLKELHKRAKRSGFFSIKINHHNPSKPGLLKKNYFDIVLVDAPCSGIGTSRRNPMHKWCLTPNKLIRLAEKQYQLLEYYSQFVKVGGSLIYSTCSLMPEENQFIADNFLEKNINFVPQSLSVSFNMYSIDIPLLNDNANHITLFPHIHGTDGFFIAKFRRAT